MPNTGQSTKKDRGATTGHQRKNGPRCTTPSVPTSLIINAESNYRISSHCSRYTEESGVHTLQKLVVWGGCVGNCAGDSFSQLLLDQRKSLRTIIFFPERAKRSLIQPHYIHRRKEIHEDAPEAFPCLTTLAAPEWAARRPLDSGYRTPKLRQLIVLINVPPDMPLTRVELKTMPSLQRWCNVTSPLSHVHTLRADCPALEHIHLVDTNPDNDAVTACVATSAELICTLTAPGPLPWAQYRLLLLGTRESSSWFGRISMGGDAGGLIKNVLSFLHQPHWSVTVGPRCLMSKSVPNKHSR